jgi:hypothetical protein
MSAELHPTVCAVLRHSRYARWGALALLLLAQTSHAQAPAPGSPGYTVAAQRIETADAPTIDGDLSDPAWANAGVIDQLYQRQPNVGDLATEQTVVRVLYDEDNLYFGIYSYDENPEDILVRAMSRDGNMFEADNVFIKLDPGLTRRNGYSFQVSASGGRRDGLLQNNTDTLYEWNAIWDAQVQIVEDGWIAEIEIPFRSVSYDPGQSVWGLDIGRTIRHKLETVMWSGYLPTLDGSDVTRSGTMTGIGDIARGVGLDVQVYATGRFRHVAPGEEGTDLSGTGGGNLYYKITPALTGTLTFNPDFSDSPLDARQVNTTRFSLFFDETRDFFLQDAAAFEFGGWNFLNNSNNARPFFSRNIGLVSGRPVSIIGGGKLSGEYAGFGIGALSVVTADQGTAPEQVLSVARVTHPIFSESRIGVVATNGDPTGATENTVLGADFQYRDSDFLGDKILQTDFFYERSFSDVHGDDDSFGAAFVFPNEPWGGRFRYKEVGENFRPALGFANRRGIRIYEGRIYNRNRFRDSIIRQTAYSAEGDIVTGLDNRRQSWFGDLRVEVESNNNDRFFVNLTNYFERVPELFTLPRDVPIAVGDYNWTTATLRFQSSGARTVRFIFETECCRFYNGDAISVDTSLSWQPNRFFEIEPRYEGTFIRLPTGSVDIHIASLDSLVNFTPDMQLAIEVQWDNISQDFSFSGRFRWEYSPGNELFLGVGQTAIIPSSLTRFEAQTSLLTLRLGRTFQF